MQTSGGRKRVTATRGRPARVRNRARQRNTAAVVASEDYVITHYTLAWEDDPIYANDPMVTANGLTEQHREGFLYGPRGIIMQGSGQASDGTYITIDWSHGRPRGRNTWFKHGMGGRGGVPVAWQTCAVDPSIIPLGSRIEIELYKDRGAFVANDTGRAITGRHIDVFVGVVSIADANALGRRRSKVTIL